MNLKLIYSIVPNKLTARNIAKALVEEQLAACVNILGPLESFYLWEEKLNNSEEILLLIKTTKEKEATLRIKQLHPYEVPCIVTLDISGGYPSFLKWAAGSL